MFQIYKNTKLVNLKPNPQSGNVFLIIMLGVALFAALGYTISRGTQSQGSSRLSAKQAELGAIELINHAQRTARAVDRLRRNGCSESDISFYLSTITALADYEHTPEVADECKVFAKTGGAMNYKAPNTDLLDNSFSGNGDFGKWWFVGASCIEGIPSDAGACLSTGSSNADLVMMLEFVDAGVCEAINVELGILNSGDTIPTDNGCHGSNGVEFTGSFTKSLDIRVTGFDAQPTGCFLQDSSCSGTQNAYVFYSTLLAR